MTPSVAQRETIRYDDQIVRMFLLAMFGWAIAAFLAGLWAALELAYWPSNLNLEWITFGRLRPLHTNAAIFAFAGNCIFAGIYHSSQRLLKARMFNDFLSRLHFWGWQAIILGAAITLPLGFSQSKEYAELEWPLDIAITVIWVVFAVNFFGTLARRREKHLYVALWFYIATIITVAVLHIINSLEIPVSLTQSYPIWGGIQDALVQWWYGHNAVAFVLTTPFLGLMYYYVPKAANRPVYSYRLSIIHFWALVFIYIWAGPHHLLYTSLPDWAQTLGMVFSVMLWAPSWGGMINGLLTLRGAWNSLRTEPILKFFVGALTFYGMATFEGPLLSIKSVSAIGHYTDWIIGHVHGGALGWNGMLAFGMAYYLVPRLWNAELYSKRLANWHFWLALIGVVLYYTSMVTAGITQGLMWQALDGSGKLVYPDFIETTIRIVPLYGVRFVGGLFYLSGFILMLYNVAKTMKASKGELRDPEIIVAAPALPSSSEAEHDGHRRLEGLATTFSILTFIAIGIGSVISIYPILNVNKYIDVKNAVEPWSPLELAGRDIYVKEGCYLCHSQQIRKLPSDVLRFGKASTIEESIWDHPFQWGSKRIGPDLAREGKRYPNLWHYRHLMNPRSVTEKSIMPSYHWLISHETDFYGLRKKLSVMKSLGVPYDENTIANADILAQKEAQNLAKALEQEGAPAGLEKTQMVAVIAYLQALGQKAKSSSSATSTEPSK